LDEETGLLGERLRTSFLMAVAVATVSALRCKFLGPQFPKSQVMCNP
jgi:hypothetical protein